MIHSTLAAVIAFIMLKADLASTVSETEMADSLKELVKSKIASFAVPNSFLVQNTSYIATLRYV